MGSAIRNEGPVDKDIHIKYQIFMHKIFNIKIFQFRCQVN